MPDNIILSGAIRSATLSLRSVEKTIDTVTNILATGKSVNSALDNPQSFFISQSLSNRAVDLTRLLDGIGQSIRLIEETQSGVNSILDLLDLAESNLETAAVALFDEERPSGSTVNGFNFEFFDFSTPLATLADAGFTINNGRDNAFSPNLTGTTTEFDPSTFSTGERYALKFEADVLIETAGFYTFNTSSDDGSQLFLNGNLIVDNDGLQATTTVTSAVQSLDAGLQRVEIIYFENTGNQTLNAQISGPDTGNAFTDLDSFANSFLPNQVGPPEDLNSFTEKYNTILDQIDQLVIDSNYRGINLLGDENFRVDFNENRSNFLNIKGTDATSFGLGLRIDNFETLEGVLDAIENIEEARKKLRNFSTTLQNDFGIINTRHKFTEKMVSTLRRGSDDLLVADQNRTGAVLLALQTRQALGVTAVALAVQSQFSVLSLF